MRGLALGCLFAIGCAGPSREARPPASVDALVVRAKEVRRTPPAVSLGGYRVWPLRSLATPETAVSLIELTGRLPLHAHPDGDHRVVLIEGACDFGMGGRVFGGLSPGDVMVVPRGVPHAATAAPDRPALLVSFDSPPNDPARTVWHEPKPATPPRSPER